MKRAAAIVGPTPSFVRWSIGHSCAFRPVEEDHLPDPTFRQLRNLREISVGYLEDRILDEFCLHPEFNESVETGRGFPVDEVLPFFGGVDQIKSNCDRCPANVAIHKTLMTSTDKSSDQKVWAGCFGWMRSRANELNLVDVFQEVAQNPDHPMDANGLSDSGILTKHIWYLIWQCERWEGEKLAWLNRFVSQISSEEMTTTPELAELRNAVGACFENQLPLMTELIPAGESDGIVWRIEPHCSICHCEMNANARQCKECGTSGHPIPERKRKVLGLRPYMLLRDLLGPDRTEALLSSFRNR